MPQTSPPDTPDGRYFVVRGRLWRKSNPSLAPEEREVLVRRLMNARQLLKGQRSEADRLDARKKVDDAKIALGERGPIWWTDCAPDYNRHLVKNTPYAGWFASLPASDRSAT